MDRQINGQDLHNFLSAWRARLIKRDIVHDDELFGQLMTINTIFAWIDDHRVNGIVNADRTPRT